MIKQQQTKDSLTVKNYTTINEAYNFFNRHLFNGILPGCLLTLQRQHGSYAPRGETLIFAGVIFTQFSMFCCLLAHISKQNR